MVIDEVNGEGGNKGHTHCWEMDIERERERERVVGIRQKDELDGDKEKGQRGRQEGRKGRRGGRRRGKREDEGMDV